MSYQLFNLQKQTLGTDLVLKAGWKVRFYLTGTTTPVDTYQTSALDPGSKHTNPVVADAGGILPTIYLNRAVVYKAVILDSDNVQQGDAIDPCNDSLVPYPALPAEADNVVEGDLPYGHVGRYGAVGNGDGAGGGTNDAGAIQAAFTAKVAPVTFDGTKTYRCDSALNIDLVATPVNGNGAHLDMTNVTGVDFAIEFTNGVTANIKYFENLQITGPPASEAVDCFNLGSAISNAVSNFQFNKITVHEFRAQLSYGDGCSNVRFHGCRFDNMDAFQTATAINVQAGATGLGENLVFSQCQFAGFDKLIDCQVGLLGGFQFSQCALVYCNQWVIEDGSAAVSFDQCNFEGNHYTDPWFSASDNGSQIFFDNCKFIFQDQPTGPIFYVDAAVLWKGIVLRDCFYHIQTAPDTDYLWADPAGTGPIKVEGWTGYNGTAIRGWGRQVGVQREAWSTGTAGFNAGLIAEAGNGSSVSSSTGSTVISTASAGQNIDRYKRWAIPADGRQLTIGFDLAISGFTADATSVQFTLRLMDAAGTAISSGSPIVFSADQATAPFRTNWAPETVAGAAYAQLSIFANNQAGAGPRSVTITNLFVNAV